jgi:hypothetical protein
MVAQRDGKERVDQLPRQAYLAGWATPTANQPGGTPEQHMQRKLNMGRKVATVTDLGMQATYFLAGWPTPQASDGSGGGQAKRALNPSRSNDLNDFAMLARGADCPARLTASGQLLTGSCAAMASGGQLDPAHSRWLQALPPEWDAAAPIGIPPRAKKAKATVPDA